MKKHILFLMSFLFLLPLSILNSQDTIYVPGDYSTIQAAIDAANNGNVVLVAEDTYYENINFKGKAITVTSYFIRDGFTSHISNTIIDGSQSLYSDSASVVSFISGEDTTSVICGFTITGGTGNYYSFFDARAGGGISVWLSGAKMCNNIIECNSVTYATAAFGGGIMAYSPGRIVIIRNNIIRNNSVNGSSPFGGGISLVWNGLTYILSNKIIDNEAIGSEASGGGIDVYASYDEQIIKNNYIKGNTTAQTNLYGGGGISLYNWGGPVLVTNNLIVDNSGYKGGGVLVDYNVDVSSKTATLIFGDFSGTKKESKSSKLLQDIPVLVNNTIFNNFGEIGGGIHCQGFSPDVMNSIVWGNTYTTGGQISGTARVTYTDVEGGYTGIGNIDDHPLFIMGSEFYLLPVGSPCVDAGNPDPMYNDVKHIFNPGHPMPPASLTLRNDMGHFGGPNSIWGYWQWPFSIELPSTPILVSPAVGDTIFTNQVTFSWEDSDPMVLRYLLELDTADQFNNFFVDSVVIGNSLDYTGLEADKNYFWRVRANNAVGWSDYSEVRTFNTFITSISENDLLPNVFTLEQNYPNPFNPITTIKYQIPELSFVTLTIYDVLGSEVVILVNEEKPAGTYKINWYAEKLSSGIYFYRIQAGSFVEMKKMVLLR